MGNALVCSFALQAEPEGFDTAILHQKFSEKTLIIFLDIDGVIVPFGPEDHPNLEDFLSPRCWNIKCLRALEDLCGHLNAKLVISSTWRKHYKTTEWWNRILTKKGFPNLKVIGLTGVSQKGHRGTECAEWIKNNAPGVDYICIDDDSDFFPEQILIKTNIRTGLTKEDVDKFLINT